MQYVVSTNKFRIGKRALVALPSPVARQVRAIAKAHTTIKSFTYMVVTDQYGFSVREGSRYTLIIGKQVTGLEAVAEHNLGSAGVSFQIGRAFAPPVGAFLLEVWYMDRFYLTVYHIVPTPRGEERLPEVAVPINEDVLTQELKAMLAARNANRWKNEE